MDAQANKQRVIDAVAAFNDGDLDSYVAIYAPDAVVHGLPAGYDDTPEGHRRFLEATANALSDFHIEHEHLIAADDIVAAHVIYTGIHDGIFHGVRPTGKKLTWRSMVFRRFNDEGYTTERWVLSDSAAVLQQLGIKP